MGLSQVLNMKPHEILGMLEEAAGTRMYETKKVAALRTLEKKQIKVDEIDQVLSENIMPALEKLRSEREEYMSWAAANQDIDRLKRFVVAHQYICYIK
jgi:structural maintenance of chromosome 2